MHTTVNTAVNKALQSNLTGSSKQPSNPSSSSMSDIAGQFQEDAANHILANGVQQRAQEDPSAFRQALDQAFGDKANPNQLDALMSMASNGNLPLPQNVRFVDAGSLGSTAMGAYDSSNGGTIFLDKRLLNDNAALEAVYTEELGHHLDAVLGGADSAGDEGAIFAQSLLQGRMNSSELQVLKSENDNGFIEIDGERVAVEFFGYSGPGSSPGTGGSSSSSSTRSSSSYSGPGSSPGTGGSSSSSSSSSSGSSSSNRSSSSSNSSQALGTASSGSSYTPVSTYVDTSSLAGVTSASGMVDDEWSAQSSSNTNATSEKHAVDESISPNLTPLASPAAFAARREFNHAPLRRENAFQAYQGLTADDFSGPADMRLVQLEKATDDSNSVYKNTLIEAFPESTAKVGGRAKKPISTFGKLQESSGTRIGDIKDLSGLRVDIDPVQPNFADVYDAQSRVQNILGNDVVIKQDYIQQSNKWGYTGRVHSTLTEPQGITHEIQVGTRDISNYIEMGLKNSNGQSISLHDATGYKGQVYGVDLPESMQNRYTDLMGDIKQANATGETVSSTPKLQEDISAFRNKVEEALPERIIRPEPELSVRAKAGNIVGKGMGILGIAGGGLQTANGIETLTSGGDKVEGLADVSAGTTGMASGLALMSGRVALGTTTGGAVAVIDGGKDIYVGIRDGDIEQTAIGGVKAGAGTAMLAGVATLNPLLVAGGATVYAGAVVYESRDAIVSGAKAAGGWVKSWFD